MFLSILNKCVLLYSNLSFIMNSVYPDRQISFFCKYVKHFKLFIISKNCIYDFTCTYRGKYCFSETF